MAFIKIATAPRHMLIYELRIINNINAMFMFYFTMRIFSHSL